MTAAGDEDVLRRLLAHPLTNYALGQRAGGEAVLRAILAEAASLRTIAELDELLNQFKVGFVQVVRRWPGC